MWYVRTYAHTLSHFGHVGLFGTRWTAPCQAPLSMGFSMVWFVMSSSRESSWCRDWTHISCVSCTAVDSLPLNHRGSPCQDMHARNTMTASRNSSFLNNSVMPCLSSEGMFHGCEETTWGHPPELQEQCLGRNTRPFSVTQLSPLHTSLQVENSQRGKRVPSTSGVTAACRPFPMADNPAALPPPAPSPSSSDPSRLLTQRQALQASCCPRLLHHSRCCSIRVNILYFLCLFAFYVLSVWKEL